MNKGLTSFSKESILVSEKERSLLEKLRKIEFGEVVIYMRHSEPFRIEEIKKSIML